MQIEFIRFQNGQCQNVKCLNDDQVKIIISELNLQPKDVAILAFGERLNVVSYSSVAAVIHLFEAKISVKLSLPAKLDG